MVRSDNGDDGLWKEIGAEVHNDTDRLFKMIGEAYAVLSDPTKVSLPPFLIMHSYVTNFCVLYLLLPCSDFFRLSFSPKLCLEQLTFC